MPAGTGGSENYTIGQVRELNRRGVAAQIITIGLGSADGRDGFPGIPFRSIATTDELVELSGTIVFVTAAPHVATLNRPYQMLHIPPPRTDRERQLVVARMRDRALIATSRFGARLWAEFLEVDVATIQVVYPFAEPDFSLEPRRVSRARSVRVLYAGRLSPEKGIYTLLAMLHSELISDLVASGVEITFTATTAGADKPQGRIIHDLLQCHPGIDVVPARTTPSTMAALMAQHDIVVMPSNSQYWHETFGIVSIEAQHTGCRVVASADGGLPETDCGGVTYVTPDDAEALARGICEAIALGPVPRGARSDSAVKFTVRHSVDLLLAALAPAWSATPPRPTRARGALVPLPSRAHRTNRVASVLSAPIMTAGSSVPTTHHQKEMLMADKSPRQNLSKKSGKSLKEQRADKREKQADAVASVPSTRKLRGS